MKSQLSAHKFRVQNRSNMAATGPPSSTYLRTPSYVGPDDRVEILDDFGCTETTFRCVGVIFDFINPHQPSCLATENSTLKTGGHESINVSTAQSRDVLTAVCVGSNRTRSASRVQGDFHDGQYPIELLTLKDDESVVTDSI